MGHSSTAEKVDKFRYVILNVGTYSLYEVKDRRQKKSKKNTYSCIHDLISHTLN